MDDTTETMQIIQTNQDLFGDNFAQMHWNLYSQINKTRKMINFTPL